LPINNIGGKPGKGRKKSDYEPELE